MSIEDIVKTVLPDRALPPAQVSVKKPRLGRLDLISEGLTLTELGSPKQPKSKPLEWLPCSAVSRPIPYLIPGDVSSSEKKRGKINL